MYLKISKMLDMAAFRMRQAALYYKLKYYITNKCSYTMLVLPSERGIGKSYVLVKLAEKYHLPIFVPNETSARHLREMAKSEIKVIPATSNLRGLRYDMVLFDEGLNVMGTLTDLRMISRIAIGYLSK